MFFLIKEDHEKKDKEIMSNSIDIAKDEFNQLFKFSKIISLIIIKKEKQENHEEKKERDDLDVCPLQHSSQFTILFFPICTIRI